MDLQMKLYWETIKEFYTTNLLLAKSINPLRDYEEDFIDGPILELGCGQSPFLIEYSKSGREIFAIDNEVYQLEQLKERILEFKGDVDNINFLNLTILEDELPKSTFSIVILSNILHFFSIQDCNTLIGQLNERTTQGSLYYILVHSDKHPHNLPDNLDYFKHFFTIEDLQNLFDPENFEQLYYANIQRREGKFDKMITKRWLEKYLDSEKVVDQDRRKKYIDEYMINDGQADLLVIYKKK